MLFKKAQEYFKSLVTKSINKSLFNLTIFTLLVTKQTPYKSSDCPSAFHLTTTVSSIFSIHQYIIQPLEYRPSLLQYLHTNTTESVQIFFTFLY